MVGAGMGSGSSEQESEWIAKTNKAEAGKSFFMAVCFGVKDKRGTGGRVLNARFGWVAEAIRH